MSASRRRSDRPGTAKRRRGSSLEQLEGRQLLSGSNTSFSFYNPAYSSVFGQSGYSNYNPGDLPNSVKPGNVPLPVIGHPIGIGDQTLASLGTEGKSVTGRDRNGNIYTITVYGPGQVIVNDVTNDGVLDDDIGTIQLVGTSPTATHVIGQVVASYSTQTGLSTPLDSGQQVTLPSGEVAFNQLIAQRGVASIVLNGFVLTDTVATPTGEVPNFSTGIDLPGGVQNLSFSGVNGLFDTSLSAAPIDITIGTATNPLRFKPTIRIDSIMNTVFDSTATTGLAGPQTTPTVSLIVNGTIQSLQLGSVGQATEPGWQQYLFPIVGSTGRTSVQALAVNDLVVSGSATNFTVSRAAQPFSSPTSGVTKIGSAIFGGNADGLALDVDGPIGTLEFAQGLGSPVGLNITAQASGTPINQYGFPGNGLLGGLIGATGIGSIEAAPADVTLLSSNNPLNQTWLPGFTKYYNKAGKTLNNAAITSAGNIGSVNVVGDSTQSEIKTGYSVIAAAAGQQSVQSASNIYHARVRGDLVDSVLSASYIPAATGYGTKGSVVGQGSITAKVDGQAYLVGNKTALGNIGSGFYARYLKIKAGG